MQIVVATYNTHAAVGADRKRDPSRIIRVVRELDADIIGLQEVDSRTNPGSEWDQFEYYAEEYGFHAVPGPNLVTGRGNYGNLLLARLPVRSFAYHDLSVRSFEPRGAIDARIEAGGTLLRVVVTHLGLRRRERQRQLERLYQLTREELDPVLFLGDFNVFSTRELKAAGFEVPRGRAPRSYWSKLPLFALDRILTIPESVVEDVHVHRSALARIASDHLPVIGKLRLQSAGRRKKAGSERRRPVSGSDF